MLKTAGTFQWNPLASWPSVASFLGLLAVLSSCQQDSDGDLHSIEAGDCDDQNPTIHPNANERCNGIGDDCDGTIDESDAAISGSVIAPWYLDQDGDGYGSPDHPCYLSAADSGFVGAGGDCDDSTIEISPAMPELCADGVDNDCDGIQPSCGIYGDMSVADAVATYVGETRGDGAGYRLSISGDLNSDGRDDVVLSAWLADYSINGESQTDVGRVYVLYSPSFGTQALADVKDRIDGVETLDVTGSSLASGADLTGDGVHDLVVGVQGYGAGSAFKGGAFVFSGPIVGVLDYTQAVGGFTGRQATDSLGASSAIGEVVGDGHIDIIAGAATEIVGGQDFGGVYVLDGSIGGLTTTSEASAHVSGLPESYMGWDVTSAADLSGDGIPDLVVSAPYASTQGCLRGEVFVYNGPVLGSYSPSEADARVYGAHNGDLAGFSLSTGDVDGDGVSDLLVGATGNVNACAAEIPEHQNQGFAYLLYGPISGEITLADADATFEGTNPSDGLGIRVSLESDLDGDGRRDVIVSSDRNAQGDSVHASGAVYVFYGPQYGHHPALDAGSVVRGNTDQYEFGSGLAGGGDVNGDGFDDLLVGVSDGYPVTTGGAYLFLGGPTP